MYIPSFKLISQSMLKKCSTNLNLIKHLKRIRYVLHSFFQQNPLYEWLIDYVYTYIYLCVYWTKVLILTHCLYVMCFHPHNHHLLSNTPKLLLLFAYGVNVDKVCLILSTLPYTKMSNSARYVYHSLLKIQIQLCIFKSVQLCVLSWYLIMLCQNLTVMWHGFITLVANISHGKLYAKTCNSCVLALEFHLLCIKPSLLIHTMNIFSLHVPFQIFLPSRFSYMYSIT